jgi:penicillin G amidase
MKLTKKILLALAILVVSIGIFIFFFLQSLQPKYSGKLKLEGLKDSVEIFFDEYGVPHIYGKNEQDVYFALGYVHAQERLFQMELIRRVSAGRLSEIFGKDMINVDKFFRMTGINEHAELSAKEFMSSNDQPYQKAANAYLQGINTYIEKGNTPIEFTLIGIPKEKFTPKDIYLLAGFISFSFEAAFKTDPLYDRVLKNYGKEYSKELVSYYVPGTEKIPVIKTIRLRNRTMNLAMAQSTINEVIEKLPVPLLTGSNAWVIGKQKSSSGKVIFANDAHIGFSQPSVWYEAHLECPGFSFYGNHLAGSPFGVIGHNRYAAWGLTMFENDDIDFYRERLNPENKKQVWNKNHWEDLSYRKEIIKVKNAKDVIIEIPVSRHGPIVNEVMDDIGKTEQEPIALWWTYLKFPSRLLQATYQLAHISKMSQAREAASMIEAPGLNVMYGDADGNIAWWTAAKLIKRPSRVNPVMILDGASGKDDPLGYYSFAQNPKAENPPNGFVYSANNQPDSFTGKLYPGYYYPDDRAKRINEYLDEFKTFSADDIRHMQFDMISVSHPKNINLILDLIEKEIDSSKNKNYTPAISILRSWDGNYQLDDIAPVIYNKILFQILKNTFLDEMGKEDFETFLSTSLLLNSIPVLLRNESSVWWDNVNTKDKKEKRNEIFIKAFETGITQLEKQLGKDITKWKWERVHTIEHDHALGKVKLLNLFFNVGPFAAPGGNETINNTIFSLNEKGEYKVKTGPSKRIVIDFNEIENATSVLPTGQSGNPMSPYYEDQAKIFLKGESRKMMMNRDEIIEKKKSKLILIPQ